MPSVQSALPPKLARYWVHDFDKSHRQELNRTRADVFVFDLTRDISCGLIEFAPGTYVIDPPTMVGIDWSHEDVSRQQIETILGKSYATIDFRSEGFFELWKMHFHKFAACIYKFDQVVLNKLYYTHKSATFRFRPWGDRAYIRAANDALGAMYDYVEGRFGRIRLNSIPTDRFLTGDDAPWGGPHHAHYLPTTISSLAQGLGRVILGQDVFV